MKASKRVEVVVFPFPLLKITLSFLLFFFFFIITFAQTITTNTSNNDNDKYIKILLSFHEFQSNHRHYQNATSTACFSRKSRRGGDSTTFEMMHRDFCSRKIIHDVNERLQERVTMDDNQVQLLQYRMKKLIMGSDQVESNSYTEMPVSSGTRLEILNYVVTMTLGGKNMTVIVDTGSDLTWVQCQPCSVCYSQLEPIFNPSTSVSFQSITCNSSACRSLQEAAGSSGACEYSSPSFSCNYYISYGDGSYTRGELAMDRLDMGITTQINNFTFGCGRSNKGLFGSASGLMGLGKSNLSLVYQTFHQFGGVFSYCLPSSTDAGESGSLTFGPNSNSSLAYRNTTPISYTKMLHTPQLPSFYMLNLTGIAVGGVPLKCPTFGQNPVLLDSGTVITRLPPSIYRVLQAEFVKQFSGFPTAPEFSILDTCFNLSSFNQAKIPTLKLEFEGNAELNIDVNGVFYFVKSDASQACLAFASLGYEDDVPIIGNYQQKNIRVVYDTKQSLVGFAQEICTF